MSDSMGMQLRISGDASGLSVALLDAKGKVVDTAKMLENALAPAAAKAQAAVRSLTTSADRGLSEFKQGVSQSRETAMFFTQALGEFGPSGKTAQIALAGVGSMLMGGGVVGVGLAAAQVGVRLLTAAWEDSAERAKKAADEAKKASDKIAEGLVAAKKRIQGLQFQLSETDEPEQFRQTTLGPAKKAYDEQEKLVIAYGQRITEARRAGDTALFTALQGQLEIARAALVQLREVAQSAAREYDLLLGAKALADSDAAAAAAAPEEAERRKRVEEARFGALTTSRVAYVRGLREQREAEKKYDAERAKSGQAALDGRARRYEKEQKDLLKGQEEFARSMAPVTASIEAAFESVVHGTASVGEAIKGVLASALKAFLEVALKQVFANAAVAGSGAAASVAPVPFIGPALAAASMATVTGLVLGLTSLISASGGADIGNYAPLAQLHPNEMVLPAHIANPLRDSLAGGGLGRAPMVINISSPDAQGVRRLLLDNPGPLAEAIDRAYRVRRGRG